MHAAIDIRMLRSLVTYQPVDYRLRHLAGCGVVEIDERLAVHLEFEDGKISANMFYGGELWFQGRLYKLHGSVFLGLLKHRLLKPVFERCDGYTVDDFSAERISQQIARRELG
jgi:hypothetical protein